MEILPFFIQVPEHNYAEYHIRKSECIYDRRDLKLKTHIETHNLAYTFWLSRFEFSQRSFLFIVYLKQTQISHIILQTNRMSQKIQYT